MPRPPPPASLFRRLAAVLYDLLLVAGVLMTTSFGVVIARGGAAVPVGSGAFQLFLGTQVAAYFIFFWWRSGQTPGMRAWRIRVTASDGRPLRLRAASWRFLAAILSVVPLGLGFLAALPDPQRRAWHDRLCATVVVRVARAGQGRR